jgi:hypothetical protein
MESCREVLKDNLVLEDVPQPCCITLHSGFRPICLEKWALRKLARNCIINMRAQHITLIFIIRIPFPPGKSLATTCEKIQSFVLNKRDHR